MIGYLLPNVKDVGLYDGGKYCLSGSSGYNFVPVAEKPRIYSCGKRDDSADVSFAGL